jgi:uncharacterized coiled-coil DUF342 family protein
MKNKIIAIFLATTFWLTFIHSSYAINLGQAIEEIAQGSNGKNLSSGIEKKIVDKLDGKINKITSKIEGQVNQYRNKIDKETKKITDAIDEVQGYLDQARSLKAKADRYLMIAKIIIALLACGIIAVLFFMWKMWRNISAIKNSIKATVNYDEIKKRIDELEKQVAILSKNQNK